VFAFEEGAGEVIWGGLADGLTRMSCNQAHLAPWRPRLFVSIWCNLRRTFKESFVIDKRHALSTTDPSSHTLSVSSPNI